MAGKKLIFLIIKVFKQGSSSITLVGNIYIELSARHHSNYFIHTYLILVNNFMIRVLLSPLNR